MTLQDSSGSGPPRMISSSTRSASLGRRRYERTACRIPAKVRIAAEDVSLPGTVTDISPAGCYIEMLSPLPVDTKIEVTLISAPSSLSCTGLVRSALTGMGMGVAFDGLDANQLQMLKAIVPEIPAVPAGVDLAHGNTTSPPVTPSSVTPHAAPAHTNVAEVLEATVRLLLKKGLITRAELAEEIEKARSGKH